MELEKILDYIPELKKWIKQLSLRKRIFVIVSLLILFFFAVSGPQG